MLIKRIEIKNFRRLIGPIAIENLASGINVIAGDNEEGKSTILQALRALFFQRHNSTSQTVNDYQPYNNRVRPEVAVDFEWNNKFFHVRKGFCVKPYVAEFKSAEDNIQGSEVEERISQLFKLPSTDKGKKSAESDHGLWGLLWLEQGTATKGLSITSGGKESLSKALESDLGSLTGGQSGRQLARGIAAQYAEYFTLATGKEKGELKDARTKFETVSETLAECELKFQQYKRKLTKLADAQESLASHTRERTLEIAKTNLVECEKAVRQLDELKLQEKAAKDAERAASLEYRGQKEKLENRVALIAKDQSVKKAIIAAESDLKARKAQFEKYNEAAREQQLKYDSSKGVLKAAEQAVVQAEKRDQAASIQKSVSSLQQTISAIHEQQLAMENYTAETMAVAIDQPIFNELRTIEAAATEAEIEARVASAQLIFKPAPLKHAFIGEKEIESGEKISIAEQTTVILQDWGTLEITPGGADTAQLLKSAKFKRQKFSAALRKIGVTSLQEASDLLDKRKQLMSEIEQCKSRIAILSGGTSLQNLERDLKKLETQIQLQGAPSELDVALTGSLGDLRTARDSARDSERKERQALDAATQSAAESGTAFNTKTIELQNLQKSSAEFEFQLTEFSKVAMEIHEKAVNDAQRSFLEAQDGSKLIAMKIAELDMNAILERHEKAKSKCARIEREINELQISLSGLSGEIHAEGNMGLGETLERLRGEHELAEKDLNRIEKKARALKLLHETLIESEREAKEHFFEPVLQKLQPHLQIMFPGSSIVLDKEAVEIAHFNRHGVEENYAALSTGTREQLSVLTRLAIARILKERNQPSFVVLDDALVYSDASRFSKMKEIMQEVSEDVQILILTCRRADYEDLDKANFIDFRSRPSAEILLELSNS